MPIKRSYMFIFDLRMCQHRLHIEHILGVLNSEESLIINSRLSQQKTNTNV